MELPGDTDHSWGWEIAIVPEQILNRAVFANDPTASSLQNDGVSKVNNTATLRYELATFVCEGEYERGMDRILDTYLSHLDQSTQPSAWVSGFYGSGKSHLVKILEALWTNRALEDGRNPRDIVRLPEHIRQHFMELSSQAKRAGGLWSASGMLSESGSQSVRMLILGIVYKAAGLSSNYGRARFRLWTRQRGWEDEIIRRIEEAGLDVEEEFNSYLVSPVIADAIWELSGTKSMDADSAQERWDAQFNRDDISIDEMEEALREVLRLQSDTGDGIPLTLIVLDEAQQFIGDSGTRAQALQEAVERIQTAFESKVLVVATGQAALNTTPNLQKLQGRFTVNVMLSDKDVEKVVREVVLRKDPAHKSTVQNLMRQVEGEIDRHIQSTRIGPKSDDKDILVSDYPLLPTRNRFWASLLHELDPTGTSGQLRTQLRVVHSANVHVANKPLGNVIAGDFIYDQLHAGLQQSAVLPRDVSNMINDQDDGTEDGALRARLIQLIFLIERLPSGDINDIGVKATPENLADLMVEDLKQGSDDLRRRIPELLKGLESDGRLLRASDGSYAIQTGESLKWQSQFQQERQALLANPGPLGEIRSKALEEMVRAETRTLRAAQGETRTPRELAFHFGNDTPDVTATDSRVVVWVRDEWNSSEKTVKADAREATDESPLIYVFLPQRHAGEIQTAIATFEAARRTVELRGASQDSPEGQQAADSMRSRANESERRYQLLLRDVVAAAQVFQGGASEVDGTTLGGKIQTAFESSLKRLFPQFATGDDPKWDAVFNRATGGSGEALKALGYNGPEENHPVIREIRKQIPGGTGTTWASIRKLFKSAPYGWPQDTIDGALAVLVASGSVSAMRNGKDVRGKEFNKPQANQTTLIGEEEVVAKLEMLAARKAFQALYQKPATDEDVRAGSRDFISAVLELQKRAGGEPPLPMTTAPAYLSEMQYQTGNRLIKSIAENANQLESDIQEWRSRTQEIEKRLEAWKTVDRLAAHADGLDGFDEVRVSLDAIRDGRQLLDDPDPLVPVQSKLGTILRAALTERHDTFSDNLEQGLAQLTATDEWLRLEPHRQEGVLMSKHLRPISRLAVSNDRDLLRALDLRSLSQWDDMIHALESRFQAAASEVAKLLEPQVVEIPVARPTFRKPADVKKWVAEIERTLLEYVNEGHPVRIK